MATIGVSNTCAGTETSVSTVDPQEAPQETSGRRDSGVDVTSPLKSPRPSDIKEATAPSTHHLRTFLLYLLRTDYATFATKTGVSCPWRIPYESTLLFSKINLRLGPWENLTPTQRATLVETALRPAVTLGIPPSAVLDLIARFQKRSYVGPTGRYRAGYLTHLIKRRGLAALAANIIYDREVFIPALTDDWWVGDDRVDEMESLKTIRTKLIAAVATMEAKFFESLDHDTTVLRPDAMKTQARAGRSIIRRLCGKKSLAPSPGPLRDLPTEEIEVNRDAKFGELVEQWEEWEETQENHPNQQ
ncbi:hypothetical protein IWX90DRAFT_243543 [Phyllosticta citrichinensis]|uniref:Uncharacterized protein n=1 Tax=Phyllosticta citrichinensis TaxID=1130410 RepID=A0ABR1XQK1_9PEZI